MNHQRVARSRSKWRRLLATASFSRMPISRQPSSISSKMFLSLALKSCGCSIRFDLSGPFVYLNVIFIMFFYRLVPNGCASTISFVDGFPSPIWRCIAQLLHMNRTPLVSGDFISHDILMSNAWRLWQITLRWKSLMPYRFTCWTFAKCAAAFNALIALTSALLLHLSIHSFALSSLQCFPSCYPPLLRRQSHQSKFFNCDVTNDQS